jgi:hypothetical protein
MTMHIHIIIGVHMRNDNCADVASVLFAAIVPTAQSTNIIQIKIIHISIALFDILIGLSKLLYMPGVNAAGVVMVEGAALAITLTPVVVAILIYILTVKFYY